LDFMAKGSMQITGFSKGALWPWIRNIDIYRCRRGRPGHEVTYAIVLAANGGYDVEGTYMERSGGWELTTFGKRVGRTMLKLTRLTEIVSPGAAQRAVFIDMGQTPMSSDFYVHYLYPQWKTSAAPVRHGDGTTLSMADGHVEYWKWSRETVNIPRKLLPMRHLFAEVMEGGDYEPQTEEGIYDLQRLQKATWGRLGYTLDGGP
jgi:prepilin-type processing-associated H-X9-DG protein